MKIKTSKSVIITAISIAGVFLSVILLTYFVPLSNGRFFFSWTNKFYTITNILCLIVSIVYIIQIKKFSFRGLIFTLFFGGVVFANDLGMGPNSKLIYYSFLLTNSFPTLIICYASYLIFENRILDNKTSQIGFIKSLKHFGLGALMAIPFAICNLICFITVNPFGQSFQLQRNPIRQAFFALDPASGEEILFRFFLYGLCVQGLKDSRKFAKYDWAVAIVTTLPHSFMHYVDDFLLNPGYSILMTVFLTAFFGIPQWLLLKKGSIQMGIGFHWIIDFIRFMGGFF
jgi:hypothetical protein